MKPSFRNLPRLAAVLRPPPTAAPCNLVHSCRFSISSIANSPPREVGADETGLTSDKNVVSLDNQSAIITGGSRGIGLAIASKLAQHGISCTLVGRDESKLQYAIETVSKTAQSDAVTTPLGTCSYRVGDVRDEATWASVFEHAASIPCHPRSNSPSCSYLFFLLLARCPLPD